MYKVLIADDEPMIREGLPVLVDWTALGFGIEMVVDGGEAALSYVQSGNPVDLLVVDVQMPGMGGIELVGRLREENADLRVIVISGFDKFDYVRAMAAYGIENYLLKPINENELEQTLKNVAGKLAKEREQQERLALDQHLIRENIINRWVYGSIGDNELQERARFLEIDLEAAPYRPALLRLPRHATANDSMNAFLCCRRLLREHGTCDCSRNYTGDILLVFQDAGEEEAIVRLLADTVSTVFDTLSITLRVVLGDSVANYWQIADSFREACRRMVYLDLSRHIDSSTELASHEEKSPSSIRLAQYVLDHYAEELSLKQLSVHFRCNAAYIGQVFKKDMGQTFGKYLKQLRLEKAKELLRESSLSMGDIAVRVGYQNISYFFSIFKMSTGQSPSEYRRSQVDQ